jgi:hypothetical protein
LQSFSFYVVKKKKKQHDRRIRKTNGKPSLSIVRDCIIKFGTKAASMEAVL